MRKRLSRKLLRSHSNLMIGCVLTPKATGADTDGYWIRVQSIKAHELLSTLAFTITSDYAQWVRERLITCRSKKFPASTHLPGFDPFTDTLDIGVAAPGLKTRKLPIHIPNQYKGDDHV